MVGTPGLEPGSLTAADFKSAVFTSFTMLPISFNGITKFHAFANLMLTYFGKPESEPRIVLSAHI